MDILDRIKISITWLITQGIAQNQEGIGKLLGYSNKSAFSQVLNAKKKLPDNFTKKLANLHDRLNYDWLESGKGEMLKISNSNSNEVIDRITMEQLKSIVDKITSESIIEQASEIVYPLITNRDSEISSLKKKIRHLEDLVSRYESILKSNNIDF